MCACHRASARQGQPGLDHALTALMNERANLGTEFRLFSNATSSFDRARAYCRTERSARERGSGCQAKTRASLPGAGNLTPEYKPLADCIKQDRRPRSEGSIQKLFWSEWNQRLQQTAQESWGLRAALRFRSRYLAIRFLARAGQYDRSRHERDSAQHHR